MNKGIKRTIAIDPTFKGFAYVVIDGNDSLIDWGISHTRPATPERVRRRVSRLLTRFEPELLVLEEPERSRRGKRAREVIEALTALADQRDVAWCMVNRPQVRKTLSHPRANKYEVAREVVLRFPELGYRMPRRRKAWMSEDERMGIFDAASFALTVLDSLD